MRICRCNVLFHRHSCLAREQQSRVRASLANQKKRRLRLGTVLIGPVTDADVGVGRHTRQKVDQVKFKQLIKKREKREDFKGRKIKKRSYI